MTLADVPGRGLGCDREARAFDCVYLMGVWKRSAVGRLMARTDPALLAEYDRVLPGWAMARRSRLAVLHPGLRAGRRAWAAGRARRGAARSSRRAACSLILDFVPNHTGFDHDWIRTNPEFYVQGTLDNYRAEPGLYHPIEDAGGNTVRFIACGRDPFFPPWRDVAQLNYFNPATRDAMIGVLDDHRAALRRRPLRHGDAGAERRLRADVAAARRSAVGRAGRRVLA